ncbi:hypothetical protein B0A49_07174 [Cryomyces minteri]|uniref:Major facilitator superfamily (MFS) profile domain-containing protein n=1 Tax=Cryomyces minteri TaxID=331657 RepID=A0A4U0XBL8_9PEZI|nr:hypothetical protein B0A49_07174 [Cryomyces minteri]
MSIFPYIYYMIKSFEITNDDRQIALYAGMVTSAFAFAEFSTGALWGVVSDKVGRKPILLTGMAGTGLSIILFGLAPNLTTALLARALGGLLNGNIGVIQSTVAEVVKVEAHQARAYSIMPFVWCLGTVIGSGLGGTLANPVKSYPSVFLPGTVFDRFPYLLPNLVCAAVVLFGLIIGILFLEETHEDKQNRRDPGLEAGKWILSKFHRTSSEELLLSDKTSYPEETLSLLDEDTQPPEYRSTVLSPGLASKYDLMPEVPPSSLGPIRHPVLLRGTLAVKNAFTRQVLLNLVSFAILAYHTITLEQLMPVLLSMPKSTQPPSLPFKFTGGLALSTEHIGYVLSVQGFLQMIIQLFLFPIVNKRIGSLKTFRLVIFCYPVLYLAIPYVTLAPENLRMACVYLALVCKVTGQAFSYPSASIMLANAAPSRKVLGTLNGVAGSGASFSRAIGPICAGMIQAAGLRLGYLGLAWWASGLVALGGAILTIWMKEEKRLPSCDEVPTDEEAGTMGLVMESTKA